ncbi:MAG: hypothetical protein KJ621_07990 [Proteobacteria bacterium]|nr:hypothetical protein [Pseudomonadota bacterium]MBU1741472.1 hypothetical protein [Pseudomonadota bacterium]
MKRTAVIVLTSMLIVGLGSSTRAMRTASLPQSKFCYVTASGHVEPGRCYGLKNCRLLARMIAWHMAFLKLVEKLKNMNHGYPAWTTHSIRYSRAIYEGTRVGTDGSVRATVTLKAPLGFRLW